jgi:general secretion pathway protein K
MTAVRNEKGMALLLVLVIVALLSSLLMEFAFSTHVDLRLTETYRDSTRAWYLSKGGIQAGRMILRLDGNAYDHPSEIWGAGVPAYPVGENGFVSIEIEDMSGKLNLNDLVTTGGPNAPMRLVFTRLFEDLEQHHPEAFPGRPDDMVAALIDWIDADDEVDRGPGADGSAEGAESAYYLSLDRPYPAKNALFDTLDELLLVRDFTPQTLRLLEPFVTVHPRQGSAVNINTAPAEVLIALHDDVDQSAAERILLAREEQPFTTIEDLRDLLGAESLAYSGLATAGVRVRSDFFRITSRAGVGDGGARTATAVVNATGEQVFYLRVD